MNMSKEYLQLPAGSVKHHRAYIGPPELYDTKGAMQFRLLCAFGLREHHSLLDFGCGSLRAGRLFISYLLPNNYYGIEPNKWLIDEAIKNETGSDILKLKQPTFFHNDDFSCSGLDKSFDFILAQSICSHAGTDLTYKIISELASAVKEDGSIFVNFPLTPSEDVAKAEERTGWVYPGCVTHEEETLTSCFESNNLFFKKLSFGGMGMPFFILSKTRDNIPSDEENKELNGMILTKK